MGYLLAGLSIVSLGGGLLTEMKEAKKLQEATVRPRSNVMYFYVASGVFLLGNVVFNVMAYV